MVFCFVLFCFLPALSCFPLEPDTFAGPLLTLEDIFDPIVDSCIPQLSADSPLLRKFPVNQVSLSFALFLVLSLSLSLCLIIHGVFPHGSSCGCWTTGTNASILTLMDRWGELYASVFDDERRLVKETQTKRLPVLVHDMANPPMNMAPTF